MIIENYILGQQNPFTIHQVLNEMIDDGLEVDFKELGQKFDWMRGRFQIVAVGCTPFGEDIFKVVRL